MLVNDKKILWTLCSFTISFAALLGTICIYTGGKWFYIAVIPSVAGLVICFTPIVIRYIPLPAGARNHKAMITMTVESLAVFSIIIATGIYSKYPEYWEIAIPITSYCLLIPWAIVLIMRYLPIPRMFRGSTASLVSGMLLALVNDVISISLGEFERISLATANFSNWDAYYNNGNVAWSFIITGVVLAVIFAISGSVIMIKNRAKKGDGTDER